MNLEFAHPYLTRICEAFPRSWVKVFHNDANVRPPLKHFPDTGFDALNWTYNIDAGEARQAKGGRMCLIGNVNPLAVAAQGTPDQVAESARRVLSATQGQGVTLSLGGGLSPGTPHQNLEALTGAARAWLCKTAIEMID